MKTHHSNLPNNKLGIPNENQDSIDKELNKKQKNIVQKELKDLQETTPNKINPTIQTLKTPIYSPELLDDRKHIKDNIDIYEFNECSPNSNKFIKSYSGKTSLQADTIKDSNLHNIRRITKDEIIEKKTEKTYNNIIKGIMENVRGKIQKKKRNKTRNDSVRVNLIENVSTPILPNKKRIYNNSTAAPCDTSLDKKNKSGTPTILSRKLPDRNVTMNSPWRIDWITSKSRFISLKNNALPRLDQEMVLDHTIVENFEESCSKIYLDSKRTSNNKPLVQKDILDYIESTQEKDRSLEVSLFDSHIFNSPVKQKKNAQIEFVKHFVSSTPIQRRILGDISNSSGEHYDINDTTFHSNVSQYDQTRLRSYAPKVKKDKVKPTNDTTMNLEASLSVMEDLQDYDKKHYRLFNEPEDILDNMDKDVVNEKKRKRRSSTNSNTSDTGKKHKKLKQNKIEMEQEKWIKKFNEECEEISDYNLELE